MENLTSKTEENSAFFVSALDAVIGDLPKRSQEIIQSRYGIDGKGSLTLEEIGKKYSITRERVRQVIREVFRKVKDKKDGQNLVAIKEKIEFTLEQHSGIMEEKSLLEELGGNSEKHQGAVKFFLDCIDDVKEFEVKGEVKRSYTTVDFNEDAWRKLKDQIVKVLKQENHPMSDDEIFNSVSKGVEVEIDKKKFFDYLQSAEEVQKNNFKKWGLAQWKEISPKGTREKAYLVLKEAGKPLHFKDIAQLIDKYKLNKRKTHPQTVHNELIKDKKFVLVGRGIYALSEWGYRKGTVKDVLEEILKQGGKPMEREEILKKVMEIRQVKKSTVIINLNNFFTKLSSGKYAIKK